jgi:hypothetical protein
MPSRLPPKWDGGIAIIVGTIIIATIVTGTVGRRQLAYA